MKTIELDSASLAILEAEAADSGESIAALAAEAIQYQQWKRDEDKPLTLEATGDTACRVRKLALELQLDPETVALNMLDLMACIADPFRGESRREEIGSEIEATSVWGMSIVHELTKLRSKPEDPETATGTESVKTNA